MLKNHLCHTVERKTLLAFTLAILSLSLLSESVIADSRIPAVNDNLVPVIVSDGFVPITSYGQVVDSITFGGHTVNAIYRPYESSVDSDSTYSCAAFVVRFYSEVYGISVTNMWGPAYVPNASSGSFSETASPTVGDIVRFNNETHWAIVKAIDGNAITLIQQNAWNSTRTAAQVNRVIDGSSNAYSFFRYSGAGSVVTRTIIANGDCGAEGHSAEDFGKNLSWTLYSDGELVISGSGEMLSFRYQGISRWYGYRSLITRVTIEEKVATIAEVAFSGCSNLAEITLPESLTTVGVGAFSGCTSLSEIHIPAGVRYIGDTAFIDCSSLKRIVVDSDNEKYSSDSCGVLYDKAKTKLIHYPAGNENTVFSIPGSVTSIGDYAFSACTGLTSVSIGSGVKSIGKEAFSLCSALTKAVLPDSVTSLGFSAFNYCSSLSELKLSNSLETIGSYAFYACRNLKNVTIPSGVKIVETAAFEECYGLSAVNLPNGLTRIENEAFYGCYSLAELNLPESVYYLGDCAFYGCGMTSVYIPAEVVHIGENALSKCADLTEITVDPENLYFCSDDCGVLYNKAKTRLICYPPTSKIKDYTIPGSVTNIEAYAFYETFLENVTIGNGVASIGDGAFSCCWGLKSISIPSSIIRIGTNAFSDCARLKSVTIPMNVKSIESGTFLRCSALTEVTLPKGLTSIGYNAFSNCYQLGDVYYKGSEARWKRLAKNIEHNNDCLLNANIHFNSDSGDSEEASGIVSVGVDFFTDGYAGINSAYEHKSVKPGGKLKPPTVPKKAGYRFAGWYTSSKCIGQPIFSLYPSAGIPFSALCDSFSGKTTLYSVVNGQYTYAKNISLYAKWETALTQPQDVFSFLNTPSVFGSNYDISDDDFYKLLENASMEEAVLLCQLRAEKWEGSCFGMSSVVALANTGNLSIGNYQPGANHVCDLNITQNSNDYDVSKVESLISFYQFSQQIGEISKLRSAYSVNESDNLTSVVTAMKNNPASPVIIGIKLTGYVNGHHAVVGYDLQEYGDHFEIKIYDCAQSNDSYYTLSIDASSHSAYVKDCSAWENAWSFGPLKTNIFVKYVLTPDELCGGLPHRLMSVKNSTAEVYKLRTSYADFSVSDGTNTTTVTNTEIGGEDRIGLVSFGAQNEINAAPEYLFTLPALTEGTYTVTPLANEGIESYETALSYSGASGFYHRISAADAGTITIDQNGTLATAYKAETSEVIYSGADADCNWLASTIDSVGRGVRVRVSNAETEYSADNAAAATITVSTMFDTYPLAYYVELLNAPISIRNGKDLRECIYVQNGAEYGVSMSCCVIFDSCGGTQVESQHYLPYGASPFEPLQPTREGFIFNGWYRDEDLTEEWDFSNDTVTGDTILYAGWELDDDYYKTVSFCVEGMETQAAIVAENELIGTDFLGDLFAASHARIEWDAGDMALLDQPITEAVEIHGTLLPDCNGTALSLQAKSMASNIVTFELVNAMNADYAAKVLLAVYDESGKMITVILEEVSVSGESSAEFSLDLSEYTDWESVKAFLPVKALAHTPVCSAAEYCRL